MKLIINEKELKPIVGLVKQQTGMNEEKIQATLASLGKEEGSDFIIEQNGIIRLVLLLSSYLCYEEFHYPQPQKGKYDIANNMFEKLKWLYRHWFNQLEVAEKDSGLEEYFRNQMLDFSIPNEFQIENKISLSSGGDLLAVDVLTPENTPHIFDDIQDFYSSADIVCANLESPVDESKPIGRTQLPGQPAKMNTSKEMFKRFCKDGGINYFSTANNHSLDWGEEGLLNTLDLLEESGSYYSGTNRSQDEQEDVLIIEKENIKIAMLSFTFDLNGNKVPEGKSYLVNEVRLNDEVCDLSMIEQHVSRAKEKGADIVIACIHWGWEFEMYPHKATVNRAHQIIEAGVDVILGNHPHVSQPMERYTFEKDGQIKNGLIVYSHGNFVAHHPKSRNSKIAYTIKFDIVKGRFNGQKETKITNLKMLPVYILNEELPDKSYDCKILKFSNVLDDKGENNQYKYGLTKLERDQLTHLNEVVLKQILLPENHNEILIKQ